MRITRNNNPNAYEIVCMTIVATTLGILLGAILAAATAKKKPETTQPADCENGIYTIERPNGTETVYLEALDTCKHGKNAIKLDTELLEK